MQQILNIEDCIEVLVKERDNPSLRAVTTDHIIMSLYRQIQKKIGLTDKQMLLAKDKILKFKSFMDTVVDNLDDVLEETRLPIRAIDRDKSVTIVHIKNSDFIKIKFPFNKKIMTDLSTITVTLNRGTTYLHERGTNEHFIKLTEENILKVFEVFLKKTFFIDPELVDLHTEIQEVKKFPEKYLPGIHNNRIVNLPDHACSLIEKDLGKLDLDTRVLYKDRSLKYGLSYFDYIIPENTLAEKIANRTETEVLLDKSLNVEQIVESLITLKRDPFIVLINESNKQDDMLAELQYWNNEFSKFYKNSEQSVLFRVDSVPNTYTLNDYVKENQLNNWVDENTKVVYIKKSRLPSVIVKSAWKPATCVSMTLDTVATLVKDFVKQHCDLIAYRDEVKHTSEYYYKRTKLNVIV